LAFNIAPPDGSQRPAFFSEPRLRKAIAFCIDRPALAQTLYGGLAPVLDTYLPPGHPLLETAKVTTYAFDLAAGSALLEEIGWRDMDGDGIREAHGIAGIKTSTPLQLELVTSDAPLRQTLAALIAADLEACGVGVTVQEITGYRFLMKSAEAPIYGRNFDLALFSWSTDMLPPCDLALSSEIPSEENAWSGRNITGYNNPGYDVACQGARLTLPGTTQSLAGQQEALRIFSQDLPFLPLFLRVNFGLTRPDLVGLIPDPTQGNELWNVEAFRLP
jgi:peptide/nickel transport system substrate-binding protein